MSGHLGNLVLPSHIEYFLKTWSKIYRFGIFLNKGISILKDKGIEIGELQITLKHSY